MKENMIYTKGFIEDGCINIPGVYLEEGVAVDLAIKVATGKFEIAMFPSQEDETMTDEEKLKYCIKYDDCNDCPLYKYCKAEFESNHEDECDEVICTDDCNNCILNRMKGDESDF